MVINKSGDPTGCCRVLDDPSRWFSVNPPSLADCTHVQLVCVQCSVESSTPIIKVPGSIPNVHSL